MRHRHFVLLGIFVVAPVLPAVAQDAPTAPFTQGISDAESLTRIVDARIARARRLLEAMLGVKGARTVGNTLVRYDELLAKLGIEYHDEPITDTLATLIVEGLGRVPKPGDNIDTGIGMLVVENMARRRITRVGVHLSQEAQRRGAEPLDED